jgi:NAD-dependent DNA ligase
MSKASRGISIVWAILAIALAGGAAITAYLQYLEAAAHRQQLKKLEDDTKEVEKLTRTDYFYEFKHLARLAGWQVEQPTQIEQAINLIGDRANKMKTDYTLPGKAMALYEIARAAEIQAGKARYRNATAKQAKSEADGNAKMSQEVLDTYARLKDNEISGLQADLQKLTDVQTEDVRRYEQRKTALEAEDGKLVAAKSALEKQNRDALLNLANEFNRIDTQLKDLVKQEAVFHDLTEEQGRIIDPALDQRFAFITLGSRDRVIRGLKFKVYVREAGGNVRWKGEVEVKDVYEHQSKVSIVSTSDFRDPIIESDLIFNPIFSATQPKRVVLAGDFTKQAYKKEDAIARIQRIGGIVDEAVSDNTDFVIVGESYQTDPSFEKANLLSVPWRPAFEIFEYIGD